MPLSGLSVLITGAGRGLGRLFADVLAEAGAQLVITGRDVESLRRAAEQLTARGTRVLSVPGDVTDPDAVPRAVARAVDAFGTVDVLVNNAGVPGPHGPTWEVDADEWWNAMRVNFEGTWRACRAVLPLMVSGRAGRIVNLVSTAGRHRWPHCSAYSVSKAAVIKLADNLAPELRGKGVAVFSFHPGLLPVGLTGDHLEREPSGDPWEDRVGEWLRTEYEAGRFTSIESAGRMLVRLCDGSADELSGRYLTPEDDLDAAIRESREKRSVASS
jgi:NAD(P)-dependent dehydrogenase (short-subunit alcohol dehydrogenase family)